MCSYDEVVPEGTVFFVSATSGALSIKTTPIDPTELQNKITYRVSVS